MAREKLTRSSALTWKSMLPNTRALAAAAARPIAAPAREEQRAAAHHQRDNFAAARAEGEADAELAAALPHRVRDHPVDADAREDDRDRRERAEHVACSQRCASERSTTASSVRAS